MAQIIHLYLTALWLFVSILADCASAAVLETFQVIQPPIVPHGVKTCPLDILRHEFANSYGSPEIVQVTPPTGCGSIGSWSAITFNFTVTSNGTQYDRLGIFTFQNVEIWRTSTPEPLPGDGIVWTYIKDLDNLLTPGRNGNYTASLQATYYSSSSSYPPAGRADTIIPLSTMVNDTGNDASVPPKFSLNVTLPSNTVKLYAELFASGNSLEESWYLNAANDFFSSIPSGSSITNGQGPFREVRLLIDGKLAGVAFPYAVIFTGGFVPSFWRPITAYGALDLPTYFIDLTPFVPLLTDGNSHNFAIDVASAETDHNILQNWYVSGLLQVITDPSGRRTRGKMSSYTASPFAQSTLSGTTVSGNVDFTVNAARRVHIESDIITGSGKTIHVIWSQDMSFQNHQRYEKNGTIQLMQQRSSGKSYSTHNGVSIITDAFSYPLNIDFKYLSEEEKNWTTSIDHSYIRASKSSPFTLSKSIYNRQITTAGVNATDNYGTGVSNNSFIYIDIKGNTYKRLVNAVQTNITLDEESGSLTSRH
ncbi:peptide N-acetyl-beta-D-glucosaminyl asparaginase amidase A-domain-containing protein [Cyathus striatus]|nr:peptide N-acetyl-beta-D-glucosaminyl asparaginase amidase A-domain-containing protein [Cyathus striatus]